MGELVDTMANIEYGLLIAIVLDALLLFVIASLNNRKALNALSYIIAVILLVPLTFQMSRLIGACDALSTTSAINDIVGVVSPTLSKYVSSATNHGVEWFIFRRIMWSVLFQVLGGFVIFVTMDAARRRNHNTPTGLQTGRRYNSKTYRRRR